MSLPDPWTSQVALIGCYSYRELAPLPSVINNLERLSELLASEDLWGLPSKNCHVLPNPSTPAAVLDVIHEACTQASDTLLIYYAGHGLLDPHTDELYLALPESSPQRLYCGVRYEDLRREVATVAAARSKVVILDCCYSGRAMYGVMNASMEMADQARIAGTYLMTASAENAFARAPAGEKFTAFTNELVTVLDHGILDGPDFLNMGTLYWHIRKELHAKRLPLPQQRGRNGGEMIVIARNRRGIKPAAQPVPPHRPLPEPPRGSELFLHRPPREIASKAARLTGEGHTAEARQLLAAAAVRKPDQEVAALICSLRADGRSSDTELVIDAVTLRPAEEIVALLDALRQIGSEHEADLVLIAAACGRAENAATIANSLANGSRDTDLRRLLDSAISARQRPEDIIALIGALSSIGLGQHVCRLLSLATESLTETDIAALGDALRGAGHDEAAFQLYASARNFIARRPAQDVASLLRAMRDKGHENDADMLLDQVCLVNHEAHDVMDLAVALWAVTLGGDSSRLLEAAASTMAVEQIAALAGFLRDVDRHEQALRLCVDAAARQPVPNTVALIRDLRDAGRPVDIHRVLDSSQAWPPAKSAELITLLRRSGNDADANRVLAAVSAADKVHLIGLLAELRSRNRDVDADRLVPFLTAETAAEVCGLASYLFGYELQTDAEFLLTRIASRSAGEFCELIAVLERAGISQGVRYLIKWLSEQDVNDVFNYFMALHERPYQQPPKPTLPRRSPDNSRVPMRHLPSQRKAEISRPVIRYSPDNGGNAAELMAEVGLLAPRKAANVIAIIMRPATSTADYSNTHVRGMLYELSGYTHLIAAFQEEFPSEIPVLMWIIVPGGHTGFLSSLVLRMRREKRDGLADSFLVTAATQLDSTAFLNFYTSLHKFRNGEARRLIEAAMAFRPASLLDSEDSLAPLLNIAPPERSDLIRIASRRPDAEIPALIHAFRAHGFRREARQLRKYHDEK